MLRLSAGTSVAFTLAGLSAAVEPVPCTETVLRFEVNVSLAPEPVRAQPSGTLSEKPAAGTLKRTNWVLSGMSPGGGFSFAFGLTAFVLVVCDVALGGELLLLDPQALIASVAIADRAQITVARFMAGDRKPRLSPFGHA
jgi:hypothetical protein